MSEIFDYLLGRTEKPNKIIPTGNSLFSVTPLSLDSIPDSDTDQKSDQSHSLESLRLTGAKPDIYGNASFNLDLADYRVKSVLDPLSVVGEQFRLLRAKLSLVQKQRNIKSLLVTSASPGEGKTFTACSLAGVLAQEPGRRILLVDADMRRPMAGKELGVPGSGVKGLSDVLRGEISITDALLSSSDATLFLLPSGEIPLNPSELLSSPKLEESLKSVAEFFDWIIIDSPPVAALADTSVIAPICDAVIMVLHINKTPSKLIQEAIQVIGREKILGIVMNRIKHLKTSRYYYKYYRLDNSNHK